MPSNPGEGDAYRALKGLLLFTDIPALQRQRMIKAIEDTYPSLLPEAAKVRARLTKQGNGPKYEVFYNVKPIVEHVQNNATRAEQLSKVDLTHITVTAVRLSTLMRSVDLSNTTSGLFEYDNRYYLRYVDKNGKKKTQVIAGATLKLITAYLYSTRSTPALHLIRHVNNDALCTRADRLAKFSVQVMETCGVDTTVFKAHSIRGASATYLLYLGVPKSLIQAHGFWSSSQTLDDYYARLHMLLDWDDLLAGNPMPQGMTDSSKANSLAAGFPVPLSNALEATTEAVRGVDEAQESQLSELRALGLLRPLYAAPVCPRCRAAIKSEAAYVCSRCSDLFHVRCLHRALDASRSQTRLELRQYVHTTLCQKCYYVQHIHDSSPQIEDPMGITTATTATGNSTDTGKSYHLV